MIIVEYSMAPMLWPSRPSKGPSRSKTPAR